MKAKAKPTHQPAHPPPAPHPQAGAAGGGQPDQPSATEPPGETYGGGPPDPRRPARGVVLGALLGGTLWAAILLLLRRLFG